MVEHVTVLFVLRLVTISYASTHGHAFRYMSACVMVVRVVGVNSCSHSG